MNTVKPDISIVIVSYNVRDYLCKCLDSAYSQRGIIPEIIVVDNNSTDGTLDAVKSGYPDVKVIANPQNVGFSAANNQGIAKAGSEYILLLNPDTELQGGSCLESMRKYMDTSGFTGILAPCLINSDGTLQVSFWHFPRVTDILLELFYLHRKTYRQQSATPFEIEGASGAALCFKRQLAEMLGGLDEKLFWMEDIDFCYRAHKAGQTIMYHPAIKVVHHGGKSSAGKYSITIPNQVMSRVKFFKKHGSAFAFFIAISLTFIFIITRLLIFSIIALTGNRAWRGKAKAYAKTLKMFCSHLFLGHDTIIGQS